MKKILFVLISLLFIPTYGCEKENENPPQHILNQFEADFPNAEDVEWEEEDGHWEVEFEIANLDHEAEYSNEAVLLSLEAEISVSDIPQEIQAYISSNYSGWTIEEGETYTTYQNQEETVKYEVEIKKGMKEKDLLFDQDFNFIEEGEIDED